MKKKNFVLLSIATVIIPTLLSLFIPKSFGENIKIEDINYIYVFDGNNGKEFTINNINDVEYIVNNIKNNKVKINSLSLGYMGYGLKIKYMDSKGKTLLSFILNSKDTIRKDPFFYKCNDELCFEYIKKLENELNK